MKRTAAYPSDRRLQAYLPNLTQVFVRAEGLEPSWLTPHGPKPCACTNSATPAGALNRPAKDPSAAALTIAPDVERALKSGTAIGALESPVITQGVPHPAAISPAASHGAPWGITAASPP